MTELITKSRATCSNLFNITQLSTAQTRSITTENVYGEKGGGGMADLTLDPQPEVTKIGQVWNVKPEIGGARELGRTWKVRPCLNFPSGQTTKLVDIGGSGTIRHCWITVDTNLIPLKTKVIHRVDI